MDYCIKHDGMAPLMGAQRYAGVSGSRQWQARLGEAFGRVISSGATRQLGQRNPCATGFAPLVSFSATIHLCWAGFGRKTHIPLGGFAFGPQALVAKANIVKEQLSWLQTGLLSARLLYLLQGLFLCSEQLRKMRPTYPALIVPNHAPRLPLTAARPWPLGGAKLMRNSDGLLPCFV